MSPEIADVYAKMLNCQELNDLWMHNGKPQRPKLKMDLLIAAVAKVYRMPIATRNTRDFIKIARCFDLVGIYDPRAGIWTSTTSNPPPPGLPGLAA